MRSSTFSFDRAPAGTPLRVIVIGLVLVAILLCALEITLRVKGGRASVPLSKSRWAAQLERGLASEDHRTTLLLGASRIRSGFSSHTFKQRFPGTPVYFLATSGESPMATLTYLAEQTKFSGKLIVALHESALQPKNFWNQEYYVEYFEKEWNWNHKINFAIGDYISSELVFRQENYSISNTLKHAIDGRKWPSVPYWRLHTINGESFYDFSLVDNGAQLKPATIKALSQSENPGWFANLSRIRHSVAALNGRGATVALVRFRTSGNRWNNDRLRWPRERYWNRLAAEVDAIALHFMDVANLRRFELPDQSHIDQRDKDAFTDALLDALIARGMTWD